jgi:hypothetical protein
VEPERIEPCLQLIHLQLFENHLNQKAKHKQNILIKKYAYLILHIFSCINFYKLNTIRIGKYLKNFYGNI